MTDRYTGFIVTLEQAIRSDDAQPIINAIRQIKGVVSVKPAIQNMQYIMARESVRCELHTKIYELLEVNDD